MKIVLAFFQTSDASYQKKIEGICRYARKRRWHVEPVPPTNRPERIKTLLDFWQPVGCIVEGGSSTELTRKMFGSCPVVYIHHRPLRSDGNASVVQMNDRACVEMAIEELCDGKPSHLAFISYFRPGIHWNQKRAKTFADILSAKGIPHSVFEPGTTDLLKMDFIRALRAFIARLPKPSGLLACNDEIASAAAIACAMEGLRVPRDMSIIGIDDSEMTCCNVTPELSSVRPNFSQGGYLAAELLDRAIRHPERPGWHVEYNPEGVTRRGSTRVFTRKDPCVDAALRLIQEKASSGLTARDALVGFDCSRRLADERFRQVTGKSALETIHEIRLANAEKLLSNPRQELDSIANLCGYETTNSFRKFFTQQTGLTPLAWRKKHLGR